MIIIIGNTNAKIGQGRSGKFIGDFGLGIRNERGENFCRR